MTATLATAPRRGAVEVLANPDARSSSPDHHAIAGRAFADGLPRQLLSHAMSELPGGNDARDAFAAWWFEPSRYGRLLRIARDIIRDADEASDVLQESALSYLKHYGDTFVLGPSGEPSTSLQHPDALAKRIVFNKSITRYRSSLRHPGPRWLPPGLLGDGDTRPGDDPPQPPPVLDAAEIMELRHALEQLRKHRPDLAEVVDLHIEGSGDTEIAEQLGISRDQTYRRRMAGLRWLRSLLDKWGYQE